MSLSVETLRERVLEIYDSSRISSHETKVARDTFCSFIENKVINYECIEEILASSCEANHWANFGPVNCLLNDYLKSTLAISEEKEVLTVKSATDALIILTSLKEIILRKKIRWVVSNFGFFSTRIGLLHDSLPVDCGQDGMLSLAELKSLPTDSWDGLLLTNIFGLADSIVDYIEFCRNEGKALVVDSALAFQCLERKNSWFPAEAISFHQTKPWGLGEGGCLIIDKSEYEYAKALINFGVGLDRKFHRFAMNSKLSDFSSALILYRLMTMPRWENDYKVQAKRVVNLVRSIGGDILGGELPDRVMGNVPVIFNDKVPYSQHKRSPIVFGKYYQPLITRDDCANDIFNRILNIPCHKGVSSYANEEILNSIVQVWE